MRISDWSSDVCSSDLRAVAKALAIAQPGANTSSDVDAGARTGVHPDAGLCRSTDARTAGGRLRLSERAAHQVPAAAQACNIRTEPRLVSVLVAGFRRQRSEERRVGKGCVSTCRSR